MKEYKFKLIKVALKMFSINLTKIIKSFSKFVILGLLGSTAVHAVTINPANIGVAFWDKDVSRPGTGQAGDDSFRVMFGDLTNADQQLISYNLQVNEAQGSATVFISGLSGRIFEDITYGSNSTSVGNVTGNISFTWSNLTRDAAGNLVGRTPVGEGTLALYSDYFDGGSFLTSVSPKGSMGAGGWGSLASPTNPLFFFLGEGPASYQFYTGQIFSAWFMGDQAASVNGNSFDLKGDFHGQIAGSEIPEPASMLLLGSSLFIAPLRKRMKKA